MCVRAFCDEQLCDDGRGEAAAPASALLRSAPAGTPTILVTHKTNIRALTGVTPKSGETLIVNRRGRVLARIPM